MIGNIKLDIQYKVFVKSLMMLMALWIPVQGVCQTQNTAIMNARTVVMCAQNIEWKNLKHSNEFTITVVGKLSDEFTALTANTEGRAIAGRKVTVLRKNVNELVPATSSI